MTKQSELDKARDDLAISMAQGMEHLLRLNGAGVFAGHLQEKTAKLQEAREQPTDEPCIHEEWGSCADPITGVQCAVYKTGCEL